MSVPATVTSTLHPDANPPPPLNRLALPATIPTASSHFRQCHKTITAKSVAMGSNAFGRNSEVIFSWSGCNLDEEVVGSEDATFVITVTGGAYRRE